VLRSPAARLAPLLYGSGLCALVYQIAWQREFRLIFGASTAAAAAVLAIFIGGLGLGGLKLGPWADRHRSPMRLYADLETGIALSAALTPLLLVAVRRAYIGLGGTLQLGLVGATALRLLLTALVLALPTFLMGGTLSAAARAVETRDDLGRRAVALLYAANTLGAVTGALVATFVFLELFGTRSTVWLASLLNLLVAVFARHLARGLAPPEAAAGEPARGPVPAAAPAAFVLTSAAGVGAAFFLMELVWYRMLGPLLGGSVFSFGLILAVALAGIGLGGLLFSLMARQRVATLRGLAWTCLLEAACLGLPYALGDRIAILAAFLRPLGAVGFGGHVLAWSAIAGIVVFPASLVAGAQFPLLIALLGQGQQQVGRQVGLAYACNTGGAILGSLVGGFGLIPILTAPGCWRAVVAGLLLLGLAALTLSMRRDGPRAGALAPGALLVAGAALLFARGPTPAWRHSGIGVGLNNPPNTPNGIINWVRSERRLTWWEADGIESSVALQPRGSALAFSLNGKLDGNCRTDAPTQVVSGLLGALVHPDTVGRALVIGLGTGSTAGWLGALPDAERVDVVELEPAVREVARACAAVNQHVLENPRVHFVSGDARELLLTTPERYDVIFSEPSNPYRSGIASLFTREYYAAAAARLRPNGLFVQWVQAYWIDARTVRTIYATLASVFPAVEIWQTYSYDTLLIASQRPIDYDASRLRARLASEPIASAFRLGWRADSLEAVLAHRLAGPALVREVARREDRTNSDDMNLVEFGFARTIGAAGLFDVDQVRAAAQLSGDARPSVRGHLEWERVEEERYALAVAEGRAPAIPGELSNDARLRLAAQSQHALGDDRGALAAWRSQAQEARSPSEVVLLAELLAELGDEGAIPVLDRLKLQQPIEAQALLARLRLRQSRFEDCLDALETAFVAYRADPWPAPRLMWEALATARELFGRRPDSGARLIAALGTPFAVAAHNEERLRLLTFVGARLPLTASCVQLLAPLEPHFPWQRESLVFRARCYAASRNARAALAARELSEFLAREPAPFFRSEVPAVAD